MSFFFSLDKDYIVFTVYNVDNRVTKNKCEHYVYTELESCKIDVDDAYIGSTPDNHPITYINVRLTTILYNIIIIICSPTLVLFY